MNSKKMSIVLVVFVIYIVCMSEVGVNAARILSEDLSQPKLISFPRFYDDAKETMSFWFQRLASGPSPEGPGH